MKHVKLFEQFVNESKIDKMSKAWYYEEVQVPGFTGNKTTVKSNKDATKAASALVNYWEKLKSFESSGFSINPDRLKSLENLSLAKVDDIIEVTVVDGKADKDYKYTIEVRDESMGVPTDKHLYVKVQRVG